MRRLSAECLETRRLLAVISIAADNADRDEEDSGVTPFTFEISRIGDTTNSATVDYSVFGSGQNPANVVDFNGNVLPTGQIIFFAGQSSRTLTVNISGDRIIESDETFTVNLSNPSDDSTFATASAIGTIRDDDAPPPSTLSIVADNADRNEGVSGITPFTFTVARTGDLSGSTTVEYDVLGSGSQPANVDDFNGNALPSGQVVFFAGQASRTVTINVSGDSIVEDDESFIVTLSNPSGSAIIEDESATGIIRDDDQPLAASLEIVSTNADRQEGDTGFTPFIFTVTRDGNTTNSTTVDYSVVGTGSNPANIDDFNGSVLPNGQVTFFSGQVSQTITINVTGDLINESDETFTVMLSNPSGQADIANGTATGTIRNDDQTAPPSLAIVATNADRDEGDDGIINFQFTVTRDGDTSGVVLASYDVIGSGTNPANAADFSEGSLPSGSVVFADGESTQTISIPVRGDLSLEPDETFLVALSNPTAGASISSASANGIIRNDDSAAVAQLAIAPVNADRPEGDFGTTLYTFNVTRSGLTSGITLVSYAVSSTGSNPADPNDFFQGIFPSGNVQFNDGEVSKSISIPVLGDGTNEFDESFLVTLGNPTGGATIVDADATGIIRDDDDSTPGNSDVNIIHPNSVVQNHIVPASNFANAIIFRALQGTTLSVEPLGFNLDDGMIRILDADNNSIGSQTGDLTTAGLINGQTYAVVFPSQSIQRQYSIESSSGSGAVTTQAYSNLFSPTDSTADGSVTALDALVVINYLNEFGSGTLNGAANDDYYLDVNRDNTVTALDALIVINRLNESSGLSEQVVSQGEPIVVAPAPASNVDSYLASREQEYTRHDRAVNELFNDVGSTPQPFGKFDNPIESLAQPLTATEPQIHDFAFVDGDLEGDLPVSVDKRMLVQ
ncbi:Calx-beta domain-containing protein [Neorhodopirellula pilleata]|uniref:Calx-beta domain-containing protein n=1 Tax=Neorhodopirellula pilleata TaxID=2714738 RepID=UPI0018CD8C14|nr:Calx-beta domain-containing protein [Neorhodopirellula pilleata]